MVRRQMSPLSHNPLVFAEVLEVRQILVQYSSGVFMKTSRFNFSVLCKYAWVTSAEKRLRPDIYAIPTKSFVFCSMEMKLLCTSYFSLYAHVLLLHSEL